MILLFLGDVVGKPGRQILSRRLRKLQSDWAADFTVINVENAAGGRGVTPAIADEILALGADVLTSGNHIWAQRGIDDYLRVEPRLLRPLNYPDQSTPGSGIFVGRSRQGVSIGVINVQGRLFMADIDCPFRAIDAAVTALRERCSTIVIDVHAEATSEKLAMAWHCDGRVSAVLGTHTHIPTADARILPGGTAYCTDVGMTGPYDSVIGTRPDLALQRFLNARPVRFQVATENVRVAGVAVDVDPESGRATRIDQFFDPPGSLTGNGA